MSVFRDVWLHCDFCGQPEFTEGNVTDEEARAIAKKQGWTRVSYQGTRKDICPRCLEMGKHKQGSE